MSLSLPVTVEENAARIAERVGPRARSARGRPVFLVDGDRTLTPDDTSRDFLRRAGLDPLVIKRRFQQEGYCFASFRFHAEVHAGLGDEVFARVCPAVARDTVLHAGAVDFLRRAAERAAVFIVSAGIPRIWQCIVEQHRLDGVEVIGGIDPRAPYVFGRAEKGQVCRLFCAEAGTVIGVGDSDVDSEMLQLAHHAVVVVNHHRNVDLLPHLAGHPSVWQVAPGDDPHPGIPLLEFPALASLAGAPIRETLTCR